MGANSVIFDKMVRHQIGLRRLATGTVRDVTEILDKHDRRIQQLAGTITASSSPAQVEKVIKEITKINATAYASVHNELKKQMAGMAKHEIAYQGKLLVDTLGKSVVDKLAVRGPSANQMDKMVTDRPFNGAKLDEYVAGLAAGRANRLRNAIRNEHALGGDGVGEGIRRAITGSAVAAYQDGLLGYSRRSLEQAVRTVHTGVANEARGMFYKENDELFEGVMWVSVLDTRTSDICQNLDGTVFPLDEGPRPPAHPNCRSDVTPIVKDWEKLGLGDLGPGTREAMDGEIPETTTYPEWLAKQPASIQDEVLGPTRGKLFRDGVGIDRFTDDRGRRYTLDELAEREGLTR